MGVTTTSIVAQTYVPLQSITLTTATATITFGSGGTLPQTYTDLHIIYSTIASGDAGNYLQFNSDISSNYSHTGLYGNGSIAGSNRDSNQTGINGPFTMSSAQTINTIDIMNYSNSTTYKTIIYNSGAANNSTLVGAGTWRSTSAITSISVVCSGANFVSGSTFTLYGIKAA
jgi:hypothetical protein